MYGDALRADSFSKDILSREGLGDHFDNERHQKIFVRMAQAIVTIGTAQQGENNLALMVGVSNNTTHLFISQNGGPSLDQTARHMHAVWIILQKIRDAANSTDGLVDSSKTSPPDTSTSGESSLIRELLDSVYSFVADKALHRAKKQYSKLSALKASYPDSAAETFEMDLLSTLLVVSKSAKAAYDNRNAGSQDTTDPKWQMFRKSTRQLDEFASSKGFDQNWKALETLDKRAMEHHGFSVYKYIEKLRKVELGALTLASLAISPRRNWIVAQNLERRQGGLVWRRQSHTRHRHRQDAPFSDIGD
ncbi:hypothetical protein B0H17DRAFT_1096352 [Mycena rosella]|uniref:Uncharacterized protein n=1 Tax=Mycena rosella TaxID=1033263 RepID=A0AAD7CQU7_MYCRO|nr:hypothetical protein B0H17DRAFT_1096352 [Mycena rosella]